MIGKPCNLDATFTCFRWEECPYKSLEECLKNNIILLAREIEQLKHRQMQKHTEASVKWRNQAFYFKKRSKQLEAWLFTHGLEVPSTVELDKLNGGEEKDENSSVAGEAVNTEAEENSQKPKRNRRKSKKDLA